MTVWRSVRRGGRVPDIETSSDAEAGHTVGGLAPERLCPHCATISQTSGEFCPHCGKPFAKRQRLSMRGRIIAGVLAAVVILGGAGAGIAIKVHHDQQVEAQHKAAAAAALTRQHEREHVEAAQREAVANKEREATEGRVREVKERKVLEGELEKAVETYAKKLVSEGILEETILGVNCSPVSGGSSTELESTSGTFGCIAITKYESNGTESGTRFSATIDFSTNTYTYRLGS
jgi:hypothetical protein